ncbi:MAG: HU family DNA-binding protein [Oscillospiraceae bacterium]|nr:HU family DNA-binding protein [Oscillospiraceae bacterium]
MTKQDFISQLAEREDVDKKQAAAWVDAFLKALSEALAAGEKIQFVGFGSFEARDRAEKKVRNPQTGEELISPATQVPVFKAGKALKDAVAKK